MPLTQPYVKSGGGVEVVAYDKTNFTTAPTASGVDSVAIGDGASTAGTGSVAFGLRANTADSTGVAIGANAKAGASGAIAIGGATGTNFWPEANGFYSIAIGVNATAAHNYAIAIGTDDTAAGATTTAAHDFVLGTAKHNVKIPGSLETTASNAGVIVRSPNGTRYRIVVSDTGAVSAVAA